MNLDEYNESVDEINALTEQENNNLRYEPSREDFDLLSPIIRNFSNLSFDELIANTSNLKKDIRAREYTEVRKKFIIKKIERFEFLKFGVDEEVEGNPEPGDKESFDNYIDRCMEEYLRGIDNGTFTEQAYFMFTAAYSTTVAVASCTETYIKS